MKKWRDVEGKIAEKVFNSLFDEMRDFEEDANRKTKTKARDMGNAIFIATQDMLNAFSRM